MIDEKRPTSGAELARLLGSAVLPVDVASYEAHNAIASLVGFYGAIVARQKRQIESLLEEMTAMRAKVSAMEKKENRPDAEIEAR